jgi:hypothetical protein
MAWAQRLFRLLDLVRGSEALTVAEIAVPSLSRT